MCSDFWPHGAVAEKYGVLRADGTSERAIFVVDPEGIVRYIDIHDIGQQPDNEVLFNMLRKLNPGYTEEREEEAPIGEVVVYCTSWCPDCKKAKSWLDEHQISYVEVDIEKFSKSAQKVRNWTGGDLITPIIETRGKIIIDFNQKQLEEVFLK